MLSQINHPLFGRDKIVKYFALEGHKKVNGWLSSHTLSFLYYLNQFQDEYAIKGNITEIGVFQGRFFIALCLMMRQGEKAAAIDVFDDQHLNLDQSGVGDYEIFINNILRVLENCPDIYTIKSDSINVTSGQLLEKLGGEKIRLFSVDGCHTVGHTESDLHLASQSLVPGGVVILDDFENQAWPGVQQGVKNFLDKTKALAPFAIAYNKLYLTSADYAPMYCEFIKKITLQSTDQIAYEGVSNIDVQRVLLPAVETIFSDAFQQVIDFSSTASPKQYLADGWSTPEPWGVWSQEGAADLNITVDPGCQDLTMVITFHAFVVKTHPEVKIDIHINDRYVDTILFHYSQDYQNWTTLLPANELNNRKSIHILFKIISPKSPMELGLSLDQRKLGIGLRSIRFTNTCSN